MNRPAFVENAGVRQRRVWRVTSFSSPDGLDLPELESMQFGKDAFHFNYGYEPAELIMRSEGKWIE